jgi:hypothetical protein
VKAQELYETIYCARGEMENRIKECQLDLFADRTSTASLSANQLRLWFASLAYLLVTALRRMALQVPHEGRVRDCSPATMLRRLKRRLKSVPIKETLRKVQTPRLSKTRRKSRAYLSASTALNGRTCDTVH